MGNFQRTIGNNLLYSIMFGNLFIKENHVKSLLLPKRVLRRKRERNRRGRGKEVYGNMVID